MYVICVYECVHEQWYMCGDLLLRYRSQTSNSEGKAWWQAPLSAKPYC